jgi:biopolymer transport protein ExbB
VKREVSPAAIPAATWHHLAITAGESIALYVDAVPVARLAARLPALAGTGVIGADPSAPAAGAAAAAKGAKGTKGAKTTAPSEPLPGFKGELDELQISKVERPEGFLKLALASQGTDPAKLLVPGQEEEAAGMGSGYMAVILRSVTLDGWVVIGILAVMAFVSFWVMFTKAGYLSAVERANDIFTTAFHKQGGNLVELINHEQNGAALGDPKVLARSSLHRLYRIGANEIRKRTKNGQDLSAHAVESIRAAMDAGLVREGQRLSSQLVLLTIAISGGPFLGLLGTVVGVMITFAAIAAAGDVNVNAIAPGIAAALVATVAGLAVAIPSLFGYNWLLTRIKNVVALQQVFVDEFITNAVEAHFEHESRPTSGVLPRRIVAEKSE